MSLDHAGDLQSSGRNNTRVITFDQHLVLIKAIQVFSIEGFQYVDVLYDAIAPQEPLNDAIGFFGSAWSIGQSLRLYIE
jgi:hypothetical protein